MANAPSPPPLTPPDRNALLAITLESLYVVADSFIWPATMSQPEPGFYGNLTKYSYPFGPNQMSWVSYSCSQSVGEFCPWPTQSPDSLFR